jgi:nucleotide-binding universal stress UspA family protein
MPDDVILIAYDGSDNADHAIAVAGTLFPGATAEVVHAWEPMSAAYANAGVYVLAYDDAPDEVDAEHDAAVAIARRGVAAAKAAGFDASGVTVSASGPIWSAIVDRAAEVRPRLVVMGTRGLTGLRSALAGSVSHHVTSHAAVPVLTVPLREG